jgi:hypothetical protein
MRDGKIAKLMPAPEGLVLRKDPLRYGGEKKLSMD